MIEMQTGLPGACKTLYTLDRIEALRLKSGRPVFYVKRDQDDDTAPGVVELTLDWAPITVDQWPHCPPNSIVVIDECQKVPGFRPRPTNVAPPTWCEPAMETHRGKGIDLVLICQHPSQLHVGIRRLVGRHLHAVRKFGFQVSTIHEWGFSKDNCDKSRSDSQQHLYKFNKKAYKYYKSAEVHTHKARLPPKVVGLVAIIICAPLMGWWAFDSMRGGFLKSPLPGDTAAPGQPGGAASAPGGFAPPGAPVTVNYSRDFAPRVPGMPHTAPAFDGLTAPVEAPYPAYCISLGRDYPCTCYTQRNTRLVVPLLTCESIAKNGFFAYWVAPAPAAAPGATGGQARPVGQAAPSAAPVSAVGVEAP